MNIPDYRIEPADYYVDGEDLRAVRNTVFVVEQKIPPELEWDELDVRSFHVVARDAQHQAIGTGRLTPDHKIGRMAVLPAWRKQGVGKALMAALIEQARKQNCSAVNLHAQVAVLDFYRQFGFCSEGEMFLEAGIPHQMMSMPLSPAHVLRRPLPTQLKESAPALALANFDDCLEASLKLITEARRKLCIYTRDLDVNLYGNTEIIKALKKFAIHSREGCAQIIVQDTSVLRSQPHPIIELAQRLSSSFQFRMPIESGDRQYPSAFLLNDRDGYLFRQFGDRYQAVWSPSLAGRNRQLSEEFDRCWQRFQPCLEFRALSL